MSIFLLPSLPSKGIETSESFFSSLELTGPTLSNHLPISVGRRGQEKERGIVLTHKDSPNCGSDSGTNHPVETNTTADAGRRAQGALQTGSSPHFGGFREERRVVPPVAGRQLGPRTKTQGFRWWQPER